MGPPIFIPNKPPNLVLNGVNKRPTVGHQLQCQTLNMVHGIKRTEFLKLMMKP